MAEKTYNDLDLLVLSHNSSGDNPLLAAIAGKRHLVFAWAFLVGGPVSITWKRGSTAMSGAMPFGAGGGEVRDVRSDGKAWYQTDANEALNLALSGAVLVAGTLYYKTVDYAE